MILQLEMGPEFNRTVAALGGMGDAIVAACHEGLEKAADTAAGRVVTEFLSGQSLNRRSGRLARAVEGWMAAPLEAVVGVKDNSGVDKYKWLLGDEDRTITPKNSKYLAIPIGEGLTPSGVARYKSPREVTDGFFVRTDTQLLFGRKNGKRGKFRALFVMVKSVFVQGTDALYDGVTGSLDDFSEAIEKQLNKTGVIE